MTFEEALISLVVHRGTLASVILHPEPEDDNYKIMMAMRVGKLVTQRTIAISSEAVKENSDGIAHQLKKELITLAEEVQLVDEVES